MQSKDLVRLNELQECKHELNTTWKPSEYLELQKIVNSIRKTEVNYYFFTPYNLSMI